MASLDRRAARSRADHRREWLSENLGTSPISECTRAALARRYGPRAKFSTPKRSRFANTAAARPARNWMKSFRR